MSASDDLAAVVEASAEKCCASCGVAAIDDITLEQCPHCDLVGYCSDECLQEHRQKHEAACKQRAAELYDELLFKQPESSHLGDCPICCLPMPIDSDHYMTYYCCSKKLCHGCVYANLVREAKGRMEEYKCPFCRHSMSEIESKRTKEFEKKTMERAKLNDPFALGELGLKCHERGDYERAFQYLSRAAALDDVQSIYNLSVLYRDEQGVEKDNDKYRALLEKAAIAGHPNARMNLGLVETENGMIDRAVRHWIIAAKLGHGNALKALKQCYKDGFVTKDDFAAALRSYQAAVDATKSPHREKAKAFMINSNEGCLPLHLL